MEMKILVVCTLILGLAGPLLSNAADSQAPLLHPSNDGDIAYVSGGVGEDERQALAAMAKDYSLKLVFAGKTSGAYLADITVSIANMKGKKILEAVSNGPWFFVKLPAGRYKITAVADGKSLTQEVLVSSGRSTESHFYWPAE